MIQQIRIEQHTAAAGPDGEVLEWPTFSDDVLLYPMDVKKVGPDWLITVAVIDSIEDTPRPPRFGARAHTALREVA